jgi:hypothetical protein
MHLEFCFQFFLKLTNAIFKIFKKNGYHEARAPFVFSGHVKHYYVVQQFISYEQNTKAKAIFGSKLFLKYFTNTTVSQNTTVSNILM